MIRRHLKKICIGVCGVLMVQMTAVTPVNAEVIPASAPAPQVESGSTALPTSPPAQIETDAVVIPEGTTFKSAIPDDNFRKFINETYLDKKAKDDDKFTSETAGKLQAVTGVLDISGKKIVNLKGIEYFTNITELNVSYNNLQFVDISPLTRLEKIDVSYNDLTQFSYGKENELKEIRCRNNNLSILSLSGMTSLETLDCSNNKLTMLNVAGLYQLVWLDCGNNDLTSLGLDGLVALERLYCDGNALLTLNVSSLKNLKVLENRRSEITLKVQAVETDCGVVLPTGAETPANISNGGAYKAASRAIIWDKITGVPASFTYTYVIPGTLQNVTVTVNVDKTDFVDKSVKLGKVDTLKVASSGYNKVKLTWSGVDGATGYRIYRSTSKTSGFTKIKSITSNSKVTYTNSGISCGTQYYYKVRAYRLIDGNYYFGEYSGVVGGKPVPAKPGSVSVAKYSRTKVKLSWNKVAGASGYRIYRSKSKTSGFSKIKTVTSGSKLNYVRKTSRNVKYYYKIRAYKTVNGKKIWGTYSAVKAKTLK